MDIYLARQVNCILIYSEGSKFLLTRIQVVKFSLRNYRSGEFTSTIFNEFCGLHGIKRHLTTAYTPRHNGVSKRKNSTLMKWWGICYLAEMYQYFFFLP